MGLVSPPEPAIISDMPHTTLPQGFLCVSLLLLASCQGGAAAPKEPLRQLAPFDSDRAWQLLLDQVALGPRPAGSEANASLRDLIVKDLETSGLSPVRQAFVAKQAPGGPIAMENVYADLEAAPGKKGEAAPMLILAAHFDTKKMAFTFLGANDGASEVAVLLELARLIATGPPPAVTYRFLFLDGEEAVREEWEDPDNRYGSRHHVSELIKKRGALKGTRAFILLDMVGDKDLQLERDSNSNRELLGLFIQTSKELGMPELFAKYPLPIKDDHESFTGFGVPSVDLIDLHFGDYGNEYWHTDSDTVENCSKESLQKVGRLVVATLPKIEKKYCKR